MTITVEYVAQLKNTTGTALEKVSGKGLTLGVLLNNLAGRYGNGFQNLVFDEQGKLRPSLMIVMNDEQMDNDVSLRLNDNDRLTLITPMSGG